MKPPRYSPTCPCPAAALLCLRLQLIQLRCEVCGGRGLVPSGGAGKDKYLRKW